MTEDTKRKIDSTEHLKNIEDAAKEVATWSQAKIENARLAFSEPMPKKAASKAQEKETLESTREAQI